MDELAGKGAGGLGSPLLDVFVAGRPVTQGSMRLLGHGRMTHDNPSLKAWRKQLAWVARAYMAARDPVRDNVALTLDFHIAPKRSNDHPDLDKLVRAVLDAFTRIVYVDDAQVARIMATRTLTATPATEGVYIRAERT